MVTSTEQEFLAAVAAYADALFRHCYFRIYDREAAKDLVQETFCRCWSSYLAEGKEVKNLRALLYRIANNLIIDQSRKKPPWSLDSLMEDGWAPADDSSVATTIDTIENSLLNQQLIKLLQSLDESYRQVIMMRYLDELKPQEIAAALGLSENVVSVRINRGLKKLRQLAGGSSNLS